MTTYRPIATLLSYFYTSSGFGCAPVNLTTPQSYSSKSVTRLRVWNHYLQYIYPLWHFSIVLTCIPKRIWCSQIFPSWPSGSCLTGKSRSLENISPSCIGYIFFLFIVTIIFLFLMLFRTVFCSTPVFLKEKFHHIHYLRFL